MPSDRPAPEDGATPTRARGLWFEDYSVGRVFHTAARTVTEADVVGFAGLSGDYNQLHVDAEFARRTAFRARVAHGLLVQSISSGLAHGTGIFDGTIAALAEMNIAFVRPVYLGDTIRLQLEVVEVEPDPGPKRGRVRFRTVVENQKNEVVVEGSWGVVFSRRRARGRPAMSEEDSA